MTALPQSNHFSAQEAAPSVAFTLTGCQLSHQSHQSTMLWCWSEKFQITLVGIRQDGWSQLLHWNTLKTWRKWLNKIKRNLSSGVLILLFQNVLLVCCLIVSDLGSGFVHFYGQKNGTLAQLARSLCICCEHEPKVCFLMHLIMMSKAVIHTRWWKKCQHSNDFKRNLGYFYWRAPEKFEWRGGCGWVEGISMVWNAGP